MSNKSNAIETERLKLSLDGKQKAPTMAVGEENVRTAFRKALRKAATGHRGREDKEAKDDYEKVVAALLAGELPVVFAKSVAMTEATSVQYQQLKKSWLESKPMDAASGQIKSSAKSTAVQIADMLAEKLADHLLDAWASMLTGLVWKNLMDKMRAEAHEATLAARITGSQEEVRAGVQAYINAFHATFGAAAAEEAGKRQLVQGLIKCLDKDVAPYAPGTEKLVKEVTQDGVKLAATICEAVERAERAGKKKLAAPVVTTETLSTGGQERTFNGTCYRCGEPGHLKRDCKNKKKAGLAKAQEETKRDVRCATCAAENDHYTRLCPLQTCLECNEKGHAKLDCKSKEKKKEEIKGSPSKYPSEHPVAAAPVLKVEGKIDGQNAKVGLDTYAGCGMVLERVVKTRESEWRPTNVVLEGVADEMVKPKGAVDVMVQVGQGAPFQEKALVVSHLPGDVEALVSFDTMKKVGLVLGPDHVSVRSEVVVPLAASERLAKSAGAVQATEKRKDSTSSAGGDGEKRGGGENEALAAKPQEWAAVEAAMKGAMWDALRQRLEKLGATQQTFVQLEARGAILEVCEGPEGEAVCRIDPADWNRGGRGEQGRSRRKRCRRSPTGEKRSTARSRRRKNRTRSGKRLSVRRASLRRWPRSWRQWRLSASGAKSWRKQIKLDGWRQQPQRSCGDCRRARAVGGALD